MSYIKSVNKIGLGLTLVEPGRGGISSVARMTVQALSDAGKDIRARSYLDKHSATLPSVNLKSSNGSKAAFAAGLYKDALDCKYFLYDALGMASAHPRWIKPSRPYGVWIHGNEVWYSLNPRREKALKNAEFVLVNSAFTLQKFSEIHYPLENAHICHLATEADEAPKWQADFSGPPTVLMVGRMVKDDLYKGHKEVIEAWTAVIDAAPDARLVIVGSGTGLPSVKELGAQSPVSEKIDIHGFVTETKLAELWGQASVFALPSRGEGFGLVYVDAMRHGIPVIASTHDAGQEVNVDGQTGFNVNLDHKDELADRLITLLTDRDLAARFGESSYRRWQECFRYSNFRERLLGCIN